jgi:hypothetical protein
LGEGAGLEEGFDSAQEYGQAIGLGHDSGNTEGGGELLAKNVAKHGVNDNGDIGHPAPEHRGSLNAIHVGHGKIEDDEIRLEGMRFFDRFRAIRGFAANLKRRLRLKKSANRVPYGNFVFDDENAFGHGGKRTIARER